MSNLNGYTQMNNTLLWALMQLPKRQQLVFWCLRIKSDYTTHESDPLSKKDIADFTSLHRSNVSRALKAMEESHWITRLDQKGHTYRWELSIAKLTNAEVHEFLQTSAPAPESQPEPTAEPQQEAVPPADRFEVETVNGKAVKALISGPRLYRYNEQKSDFETKPLYKGNWEIANGYSRYLSDADKLELQAHAC